MRSMPAPLRTNLNRWLRVSEKKSNQVALPPDAGFGERLLVLAHGVVGHANGA
jgi:hypothetical protein